MNDVKQYLFPSGGSHLLGCFLSIGLIGGALYDLFFGGIVVLRNGNIHMNAILVFGLLVYIFMLEACMMIITKGCLFAYNVDKAICVPIKDCDIKAAVSIGQRLYGPIFDRNCELRFSPSPKSPWLRKFFYATMMIMFVVALISPCYHLTIALRTKVWPLNLIVDWLFIFIDAILIMNRIFFRASARRFWAYTFGNQHFRSVLRFELSDGNTFPKKPLDCV